MESDSRFGVNGVVCDRSAGPPDRMLRLRSRQAVRDRNEPPERTGLHVLPAGSGGDGLACHRDSMCLDAPEIREKMNRRLVLTFVLISVMTAMAAVQEGDETPPRFTASGLLTPAVAQGPHYRVDEDVPTVGYFHEFTLSSDFGPFEAIGRSVLAVRIHEIGALAALQDVSKTEVFCQLRVNPSSRSGKAQLQSSAIPEGR
jgi:hypothetical protein